LCSPVLSFLSLFVFCSLDALVSLDSSSRSAGGRSTARAGRGKGNARKKENRRRWGDMGETEIKKAHRSGRGRE